MGWWSSPLVLRRHPLTRPPNHSDEGQQVWRPERMLPTKGVWSLANFKKSLVSGLANHTINVFR